MAAQAADVALVGLLAGKAMVVIDGGKRQTLTVGASTAEGVKLLSVESGAAVFEIEGKRRRVQIGQSVVSAPGAERPVMTLTADARGHFITQGSINGTSMRFLVDTGATMTANGPTKVWKVKLANVKLGSISMTDVDATVHEQDMPVVLLGMSFLNRMEIRRDGLSMTLTQRF